MNKKFRPIKIRRTWTRHPAERIKEDKEIDIEIPCLKCKNQDINICDSCPFNEDIERIGGA